MMTVESFFLWIAAHYTAEAHLISSKIGGILCSYADIFVIWMFVKVVDEMEERPPSVIRFRLLILFMLLTPALLLAQTSYQFFILQFFVLGIPYVILAYSVVVDIRAFMKHIRAKIKG